MQQARKRGVTTCAPCHTRKQKVGDYGSWCMQNGANFQSATVNILVITVLGAGGPRSVSTSLRQWTGPYTLG